MQLEKLGAPRHGLGFMLGFYRGAALCRDRHQPRACIPVGTPGAARLRLVPWAAFDRWPGPSLLPAALADKPATSLVATIPGGRKGTPMPPWRGLLTEQEAQWIVERLQTEFPKE